MQTRGQVVELLSTRVKYLRVYVMPFYLVLRLKFIYNFWPGLIALAHRAAPPPALFSHIPVSSCFYSSEVSVGRPYHFNIFYKGTQEGRSNFVPLQLDCLSALLIVIHSIHSNSYVLWSRIIPTFGMLPWIVWMLPKYNVVGCYNWTKFNPMSYTVDVYKLLIIPSSA